MEVQPDFVERVSIILSEERQDHVSAKILFSDETGLRFEWRDQIGQWLTQVAQQCAISYHTIAVALKYFDRCVVMNKGAAADLHLLALSCLSIASKFFDHQPLSMADVQAIVHHRYDKKAIVATEHRVLILLDWKLNCVTSYETMATFLQYFENNYDLFTRAELFLVFAISDSAFLDYLPSDLGLASILCAFKNAGVSSESWLNWVGSLVQISSSVFDCEKLLLSCLIKHPPEDRCESPDTVTQLYCDHCD